MWPLDLISFHENKNLKNICVFADLDFLFGVFFRLYRSIGEYDVLRAIFSSEIGTKQVTQNAVLAEARSDYSEAAKQYNEVKLISGKYVSGLGTFVFWLEKLLPLEFRVS